VAYNPLSLRGASSPITVAAGTAAANAGELFGLVLAQTVNSGCPVALAGGATAKFDMRSMLTVFSAPENRVCFTEMARYYDVPHFGLGGASDSKVVDEQSAAEAALTLLVEALAGSNLIHDVGYMESGMSNSLAQIVLCDEIIGWIRRFMDPVVVDEETLALDLIERVAPLGDYLAEEHTLAHFDEDWYPGLFDQSSHDKWVRSGSLTAGEKAAARVEEILERHQVEDLPPDVLAEIDRIIAERVLLAGQGG
jgi:trimethylamine--corrinoid protein Co-methyltransferase